MSDRYITSDGDTVDRICWRYYGSTSNRVTEIVLDSNPGLADRGAVLPAGVYITLPEIESPAKSQGVRLWD